MYYYHAINQYVIDVLFIKNKVDAHDYDYNPVNGEMEAVDYDQGDSDDEDGTELVMMFKLFLQLAKILFHY